MAESKKAKENFPEIPGGFPKEAGASDKVDLMMFLNQQHLTSQREIRKLKKDLVSVKRLCKAKGGIGIFRETIREIEGEIRFLSAEHAKLKGELDKLQHEFQNREAGEEER